jgi:hypothetical protein
MKPRTLASGAEPQGQRVQRLVAEHREHRAIRLEPASGQNLAPLAQQRAQVAYRPGAQPDDSSVSSPISG